MKSFSRYFIAFLLMALATVVGFSQTLNTKTESRDAGLKKIYSYDRNQELNIHLDGAAMSASIESAVEGAMKAVEAVLSGMEIRLAPIDINLGEISTDIAPVDIHIPPINITIPEINMERTDLDIRIPDIDLNMDLKDLDVDEFDFHHRDGFDNDAKWERYNDEADQLEFNNNKDKEKNKEKDKNKGLKKIN